MKKNLKILLWSLHILLVPSLFALKSGTNMQMKSLLFNANNRRLYGILLDGSGLAYASAKGGDSLLTYHELVSGDFKKITHINGLLDGTRYGIVGIMKRGDGDAYDHLAVIDLVGHVISPDGHSIVSVPTSDNSDGVLDANANYIYSYSDQEIEAEYLDVAGGNAVAFTVSKIRGNDLLTPGTSVNVHTIDSLEIAEPVQHELDATPFIVGTNYTDLSDAGLDAHICWSEDLNTLYVAPTFVQSRSGGIYDGACSIAAYRYTPGAQMPLEQLSLHAKANIDDTYSWYDGSDSEHNNIVGVRSSSALSVNQIAVMKTSKNTYNLIVMGGLGAPYETGSAIYALPLVSPGNTYAGALADVTDTTFATRAADCRKLYTANTTAAIVGGGNLPWSATNVAVKMKVYGDTVYAAVADTDDDYAGAVYYSQCYFNDSAIASWSAWQPAVPLTTISTAVDDFDVDTIGARIFYLTSNLDFEGITFGTDWDFTATRKVTRTVTTSPQQDAMGSFLQLTATNNAFVNDNDGLAIPLSMYVGKQAGNLGVVVIRTKFADTLRSDDNYQAITFPNKLGPLLSVGCFATPNTGDQATGMLLVGVQRGLYAYLDSNTQKGGYVTPDKGINLDANMFKLNDGYWANSEWTQVLPRTITGSVRSIACYQGDLYVLECGITDKIWKFSQTDIATNSILAATPVKIFETSANSVIQNITGLAHVPVVGHPTYDSLVIGTYDGAYILTKDGGLQSATGTTGVILTVIPGTKGKQVLAVGSLDSSHVSIMLQNISPSTALSGQTLESQNVYVAPVSDGSSTVVTNSVTSLVPSSTTPIISAQGSEQVSWTDGARVLSMQGSQLRGGEFEGKKVNLSAEEWELTGKKIQAISAANGMISVRTSDGYASLK